MRLLARPEALELTAPSVAEALRGTVSGRRFAGSVYVYTVDVEGGWLEVQTSDDVARKGAQVGIAPRAAPSGLYAFASGMASTG